MDQRAPQIEDDTTDRTPVVIHGNSPANTSGKLMGHVGGHCGDVLAHHYTGTSTGFHASPIRTRRREGARPSRDGG